jgi:hypothetical protein
MLRTRRNLLSILGLLFCNPIIKLRVFAHLFIRALIISTNAQIALKLRTDTTPSEALPSLYVITFLHL